MKNTAKLIFWHLLPGTLIIFAYILFVPIMGGLGFPNEMALLMSDVCCLLPVEIGLVFFFAKKQTGKYSLKEFIIYFDKSKAKEYLIFIPLILWALIVNSILEPIEIGIRNNIFSFIPTQYVFGDFDIAFFAKEKILILAVLQIFTNGILAPLAEELYFRGFLLPRIKCKPILAATISAVLFSLYHFYSPWFFFSRILMMIPLYYWVIRKRNIRFSIFGHMIANTMTSILFLISAL